MVTGGARAEKNTFSSGVENSPFFLKKIFPCNVWTTVFATWLRESESNHNGYWGKWERARVEKNTFSSGVDNSLFIWENASIDVYVQEKKLIWKESNNIFWNECLCASMETVQTFCQHGGGTQRHKGDISTMCCWHTNLLTSSVYNIFKLLSPTHLATL